MLKIYTSIQGLDFGQLMAVYAQSNLENALELYPHEESNVAIMRVEQDFYCFLKEDFFETQGAFYAVWEHNGRYVSALRMEPYRDGNLLEALETAPAQRRKGYAKALIKAVTSYLREQSNRKVYSHVNKKNHASLKAHEACGFNRILEYAVYIDGSVMQNSCTLQY